MEFVYPILILAAVALIFGLLLAFLGKKLEVKTDPKEALARELLAGANCGACGFAGCDAFAKALAEGRAKLSECPVTSAQNKEKIAEALGVSDEGGAEKIFIRCDGGARCADKNEYSGLADCAAAASVAGGFKACPRACLGLGSCAKVCPANAISIADGVAEIDGNKCIKCGRCVAECPRGLIVKIPDAAPVACACSNRGRGAEVKKICSAGCIGCGLCAKVCPSKAITMVEGLPIFDYGQCVGCGLCAEKCPVKVIKTLKNA